MMKRRERFAWFMVFAVIAISIVMPYVLTPRPYWGVELVESRQDGVWRYITVNFVKGDCRRVDVVFSGHRLGIIDDLTRYWNALDGVEADHDRIEGTQTLRGRLFTGETQYEAYEIRTRHDCDGKRVDKLFVRIEADADK